MLMQAGSLGLILSVFLGWRGGTVLSFIILGVSIATKLKLV